LRQSVLISCKFLCISSQRLNPATRSTGVSLASETPSSLPIARSIPLFFVTASGTALEIRGYSLMVARIFAATPKSDAKTSSLKALFTAMMILHYIDMRHLVGECDFPEKSRPVL
jgi:hypothetical protein